MGSVKHIHVAAKVGLDVRSFGPISIQVQVGGLRYGPCSTHSCCSRRVCGCTILATMVFIEMFLFVSESAIPSFWLNERNFVMYSYVLKVQ